MTEKSAKAWVFRFGLESESEDSLSESAAQELLVHLIEWTEERGLVIGGGYFAETPDLEERLERSRAVLENWREKPLRRPDKTSGGMS